MTRCILLMSSIDLFNLPATLRLLELHQYLEKDPI